MAGPTSGDGPVRVEQSIRRTIRQRRYVRLGYLDLGGQVHLGLLALLTLLHLSGLGEQGHSAPAVHRLVSVCLEQDHEILPAVALGIEPPQGT